MLTCGSAMTKQFSCGKDGSLRQCVLESNSLNVHTLGAIKQTVHNGHVKQALIVIVDFKCSDCFCVRLLLCAGMGQIPLELRN